MRNSSEVWCETDCVSINEIDRRARLAYENSGVAAVAFISLDLYAELMYSMGTSMRSVPSFHGNTPHSVVRIMTAIGEIHLQKVNRFRNFLLVGVKADFDAFVAEGVDPIFWSDQERRQIDQAFEDLIIMEGEDAT